LEINNVSMISDSSEATMNKHLALSAESSPIAPSMQHADAASTPEISLAFQNNE